MERRHPCQFVLCFLFCISTTLFPLSAAVGAPLAQVIPQPTVPYALLDINMTYENVSIQLRRVDFWDGYIVFVGMATDRYGSACLERVDFTLQIGDIAYEPANREKTRQGYGLDAPGTGLFIHCLTSRKPEILLLSFVAPVNQTAATLRYRDQVVELPASLANLLETSETPPPTMTFTPTATFTATATRTPTPIPTQTFTPAPVVTRAGASSTFSLPLSAKAKSVFRFGTVSHQGIQFTLERIDFWDRLPDNTQPNNDLFLVLTGTLLPLGDAGDHCVGATEVALQIGRQTYTMDNMRSANQFYESSYPGYILPQCTTDSTPATTFFIFDVALANEPVLLAFHGALLELDRSMIALAASASIMQANADPLPTGPTRVLVPTPATQTPQATMAPIVARGIMNRNANLRAGPGTDFAIIGSVVANQTVEIIGRNAKQDWLQLIDGSWIAAFLVTDSAVPSTPTPP